MSNILWMGAEDIDFPNGVALTISTTAGQFRSGYARCNVNPTGNGAISYSDPFPGGAVTSLWFGFHCFTQATWAVNEGSTGVILGSTTNKGIWIGPTAGSATKVGLYKYDGTTWTQLATEAGNSFTSFALQRFDISISNYGASSTINVYLNGGSTPIITFTGDSSIAGVANLDSIAMRRVRTGSGELDLSECIVMDSDSRAFTCVTGAMNAAGDSNTWTGAYTDINPVTINDANAIFTNSVAQDFQANINDLPAGTFAIAAVKVVARAEATAGATATSLKLGVKTGGSIDVDAGRAPTTSFKAYQRTMALNPVTGVAWTPADINALQIDLRSA